MQVTGVKPYLLDTQYRMHPGIASFPNDLFYAGKLKSGITAADRPAPDGEGFACLILDGHKCAAIATSAANDRSHDWSSRSMT